MIFRSDKTICFVSERPSPRAGPDDSVGRDMLARISRSLADLSRRPTISSDRPMNMRRVSSIKRFGSRSAYFGSFK